MKKPLVGLLVGFCSLCLPTVGLAQPISSSQVHPWWLVLAGLLFSLLPLLLGTASAYLKVSIVLNLLRSGLGAQGVPSAMVIMALSTALSLFVMGPVLDESLVRAQAIDVSVFTNSPLQGFKNEFAPVAEPWRDFLSQHTGQREREALLDLRKLQHPGADVSTQGFSLLLPAFLLTELREAFAMGFALLIPFLVVDLIVANILTGLGMMMASPTLISLPLKVLLFLMADGWLLLSRGLIASYGAP